MSAVNHTSSWGNAKAARHRIVCWLVLAAIPLLGIELFSLIFVHLRPGYFSHYDRTLRLLSRQLDQYPEFLEHAYDPVVGWDNAIGQHRDQACDGRAVTATIGPDHTRRTPAIDGGPEVLLFGDSYVYGDEVEDEETFAWHLSERLRVRVRNHGVRAYSPLQAALEFERVADAYPRAKVAVLGIMHEDVKRMLGRYRPVEFATAGPIFGFRPYVRDGRIMPNPNGPTPVPAERLPALARAAFLEDSFRPEPHFPFNLRVAQLLTSQEFYLELTENRSRTYRQYFEEPEIVTDLAAVVGRFVTAAERHGMRPVVAFIPRTRFDREDAIAAIGALGARFGGRATFSEAGDEPGDWDHYNIKNAYCHPSASGHVIIAAHLARVIEPLLATGRGLLARDGINLP